MGTEQLFAISAIIVALGVIVGASVRVYRVAHRIDSALGVDREGRTVADRLARVEHQLWPNGGSSMNDKLSRVEKAQAEQSAELRVVHDLLTVLVEQDRRR